MPSAQDILDSINGADSRLDNVNSKLDTANGTLTDMDGKLDAIRAAVLSVDADIQKLQTLEMWGFTQLITLGTYADLALAQNAKQNDTIICILEHISQNTCALLTEAHTQTTLQTSISESIKALTDLYAATHAEAELAREREEKLRKQIEACCPPPAPDPACTYRPCQAPPPLREQPPSTAPPPNQDPQRPG
jgi:DNA repair exonuclease SbcCD ATPase subunit